MRKNISILLLTSILIFLIVGMGFAYQNEPDGFRGLKWGDAPTEDMKFFLQMVSGNTDRGNIYHKRDEKKFIGNVKFWSIEYTFNLRSNQLYKVEAACNELNDVKLNRDYNILKMIFEERYGEPTRKLEHWLCWEGDKTNIYIYYNSGKENSYYQSCRLIFESVKIPQEDLPEINEQEEIEKAKEDF